MSRPLRLVIMMLVFYALSLLLVRRSYGAWPTNYQHFTEIRSLAKAIPYGTHIRFTLNDGSIVFGTFLNYESYNDYIWYQPQNTTTWWAQDAFEIHELLTLEVVEPL